MKNLIIDSNIDDELKSGLSKKGFDNFFDE